MNIKRAVVSTGGTGGHVFPALAVIEELQKRYPFIQILFLGGEKGPEKEMAEKAGVDFIGLPARGVLGKGLRSVRTVFWLGRSIFKCLSIYRKFTPEVVIGFGSYAGFVPVLLASLKKIPSAVHEQNSSPGTSNKFLGRRVDRVLLSFPDKQGCFRESKTRVTGNPVRGKFEEIREKEKTYLDNTAGRVFVLGGSQGAKAINDAVINSLPRFNAAGIQLVHQCGKQDLDRVLQAYREQEMPEEVYPFIENVASVFEWADLIVSRAGASTVAELTTAGRPSVLIPYPYAVQSHQLSNARSLEQAGAAIVLEQSYLQDIDLARVVCDLLAVPQKLKEMGTAAKGLGNPGAASKIVDELQQITK